MGGGTGHAEVYPDLLEEQQREQRRKLREKKHERPKQPLPDGLHVRPSGP